MLTLETFDTAESSLRLSAEQDVRRFLAAMHRNFKGAPGEVPDKPLLHLVLALVTKDDSIDALLGADHALQLATEALVLLMKTRFSVPTGSKENLLWMLCESLARRTVDVTLRPWALNSLPDVATSSATVTQEATATDAATRPIRHYVHGDEHEGEPGLYYCSTCERFVQSRHFFGDCGQGNQYNLYLRSMNHWSDKRAAGIPRRRPVDARNFWD